MRRSLRTRAVLRVWIAAVTLAAGARAALADDHGDSPQDAAAVIPDGAAVAGVIDFDTDRDWFSFVAMPGIKYRVSVSDGSVWNTDLTLVAPDASTDLYVTNTAAAGSPGRITWSNNGAVATCYVCVNGLVEYTTGTYSVAVTNLNFTDTDGDGMPDGWELAHFGTLTNAPGGDVDADRLSNIQEYYMGTAPELFASGLYVVDIQKSGGSTRVTWPSVRYGSYRVEAAGQQVDNAGWSALGTEMDQDGAGSMEFVDADGTTFTSRFYRIQFVY